MLFNPSHKITFSGLPPDVLDAYVRYKKGTRALVAWFLQYSDEPNRKVKSLPIKELAAIAERVSAGGKALPDVVDFHFKETIAARNKLSKYYRGNIDQTQEEVDTVNHEHFTTSLAKIYADLKAECGQRNRRQHRGQKFKSGGLGSPDFTGTLNHYDKLGSEDTEDDNSDDCDTSITTVSSVCSECEAIPPPICDGLRVDAGLADDELTSAFELTTAIHRIQSVISAVEKCWELSGTDTISFPVAAVVTNVALAMLRQVDVQLRDFAKSGTTVLDRAPHAVDSLDRRSGDQAVGSTSQSVFELLQELQSTISHCRGSQCTPSTCCSAACIQRAAEYIQTSTSPECTFKTDVRNVLLDNISRLAQDAAAPSIVTDSAPVFQDIKHAYSDTSTDPSPSSTLGLQLLISSYQSYLGALPSPSQVSHCRLAALRLAQQASNSLSTILSDKTCFPCRCSQTIAFHLHNLQLDLQAFAGHKVWDLYAQSPWVAGSQVVEILDRTHYYGLRLFNYRHYIGAVIHSYTVLTTLKFMERVPVLEAVTEAFGELIFPSLNGSRPKNNFKAVWSRFVGARLKFKKGHRSRNSRDGWCMAIPAHAAKRAAGLGDGVGREGIDDKCQCALLRVKNANYHVSRDTWQQVQREGGRPGSGEKNSPSRRRKSNPTDGPDEEDLVGLARHLQTSFALDAEQTALPLSRVNLIALFALCVRVVAALSDATHTGKEERGLNCICFASTLLSAGDRIVEARRLGRLDTWSKTEKECAATAKGAIETVFTDMKLQELCWDC